MADGDGGSGSWFGICRLRLALPRPPTAMFFFGGAFQPQQRISGAFLQSAADQDACEAASPTVWETKVAMVVDATSLVVKRNAVHRLVNLNANWQPCVQLKLIVRRVDKCVFKGDTKMQPAWARLTQHALAFDRRPRRFDAGDANVKETAPSGDVGEQLPHDPDGRLDDLSGTSCVIRRRNGERVLLAVDRTFQ